MIWISHVQRWEGKDKAMDIWTAYAWSWRGAYKLDPAQFVAFSHGPRPVHRYVTTP